MKHLLPTTIAAVVLVGCGGSIHQAAEEGNIEAVKQHLAAGADVNAKDDKFGSTALHSAAKEGHKEVAELLIDKGADVNPNASLHADLVNKVIDFSYEYRTPLDVAIQYKQSEIVDLLRKHGGKTGEELKAEGK